MRCWPGRWPVPRSHRHRDPGLVQGQRARHDHLVFALKFGAQAARQDSLAGTDDRGQRDQAAARNRSLDALSVVLIGHPKLKNDLRRPKMEEIGDRATVFEFGGLRDQQRNYIDWVLRTSLKETVVTVRADVFWTQGPLKVP